jgi:hypothetical protein
MKYVAEMGSGGMPCVPSFMTTGYGSQIKLCLLPQRLKRQMQRDMGQNEASGRETSPGGF